MQLPGYDIKEPLGRGGMGAVYLAIQQSLQRPVAIKVMAPALAADEEFAHRFLNEGRVIARLVHPHIVVVHDIGVHENHYYMAMEYLAGGTLKQRIRQGLPLEQGLHVVRCIAEALGYAHVHGFVHRDVKPQNILFRADGTPVLTDFGIAKTVGAHSVRTVTGASVGSPKYMSPEQARGAQVDARSDLYALGVILYEILTGELPYSNEDPFAVALMHISEPVPRLPETLSRFQSLVDRLMAKDAGQRFDSARQFIDALDEWNPARVADPTKLMPVVSPPAPLLPDAGAGGDTLEIPAAHREVDSPGSLPWARDTAPAEDDSTPDSPGSAAGGGWWPVKGSRSGEESPGETSSPSLPRDDGTEPGGTTAARAAAPEPGEPAGDAGPPEQAGRPDPTLDTPPPEARTPAATRVLPVADSESTPDSAPEPATLTLPSERTVTPGPSPEAEDRSPPQATLRRRGTRALVAVPVLLALLVPVGYWFLRPAAEADRVTTPEPDSGIGPASGDVAKPGAVPEPGAQESPARWEELLAQARRRYEAGDLVEPAGQAARDAYRRVLAQDPGNGQAAAGLQAVAAALQAQASRLRDAGELEQALGRAEQGLSIDPRYAAEAHAALEALSQELRLELENQRRGRREAETRQVVEELLAGATAQRQAEHLVTPPGGNALDSYRQVLDLDPDNPQAREGLRQMLTHFTLRARARMEQGDYAQALETLGHGLKVAPGDSRLLSLQEQARAGRARAADIDSQVQALLGLAAAQEMAGQFVQPEGDNARETYQRVLDRVPDNPEALQGQAALVDILAARARSLAQTDPGAADELLTRGLTLYPDHPELQALDNALAQNLEQAGPDPALARLKQRFEEHLDNWRLTTGREGHALGTLQELRRLAPGDPFIPEGRRRIARAYAALARSALGKGRLDQARLWLRKGVQVQPGLAELTAVEGRVAAAEAAARRPEPEIQRKPPPPKPKPKPDNADDLFRLRSNR